MRLIASVILAATLVGCSAEIEHGLDERQANQIAALLDEHGVTADKARDDGSDAWKIVVPRGDLARSFELLEAYDLPRRDRHGMEEALAEHGLIPSIAEERARLESARAAELEHTLERVPGVVSARVHLALPDDSRFDEHTPPRASVLLRTEGQAAIGDREVRALVAGATSGLAADAVSVVITSGRAATEVAPLEPVGPVRVARGEKTRVVAIAASGVGLVLLLGAALLFTALRLVSLRGRVPERAPPVARS
jgi:type III secretion protein J